MRTEDGTIELDLSYMLLKYYVLRYEKGYILTTFEWMDRWINSPLNEFEEHASKFGV